MPRVETEQLFLEPPDQPSTAPRAAPQVPELARAKRNGKRLLLILLVCIQTRHYTGDGGKNQAAGKQVTPPRLFPERLTTAIAVAATFTARLGPALSLSPPH